MNNWYHKTIEGRGEEGYAPRCFAVAYEKTKEAIRQGTYISKHQMYHNLLAEDLFVWRHDGLIKSAITRAVEEKL